jgi:hypothetical protein
MNKKLLFAAAGAISLALGGAASADSLNFSGFPGADTFTATSIDITNPGTAHPVSGIFVSLDNGSVVFGPTSWVSGGGTETMTVTAGANVDVISITGYTFSGTATDMTINGTGTEALNGGASTAIHFILTTQAANAGDSTSFSGSVSTVPLPGALLLFGSGLVGITVLGRKRKQQKLESAIV